MEEGQVDVVTVRVILGFLMQQATYTENITLNRNFPLLLENTVTCWSLFQSFEIKLYQMLLENPATSCSLYLSFAIKFYPFGTLTNLHIQNAFFITPGRPKTSSFKP